MIRFFELLFAAYFLIHIPITLFADFQKIGPWSRDIYPQVLQDVVDNYCEKIKDILFCDAPVWFESLGVCEMMQFPFFFIGFYAFAKGSCLWIKTPVLIYATHVMTTVVPIGYAVYFEDFSNSTHPAPSTMEERLILLAIYAPFFFVPLLMILVVVLSSTYNPTSPRSSSSSSSGSAKGKRKKLQ